MVTFETFGISLIDEQKFCQIVIDFISNHQGCIDEDIVKGQKQIGRKKLFRILPALKEKNIVTEKKSKPGARNKKLLLMKLIHWS
jgi:hypothetical protein